MYCKGEVTTAYMCCTVLFKLCAMENMDPSTAGSTHFFISDLICVRFILLRLHFQSIIIQVNSPQMSNSALSGSITNSI